VTAPAYPAATDAGPGLEHDVPVPDVLEDEQENDDENGDENDVGSHLALVPTEGTDSRPAPLVRTLADLLRDPGALTAPEAVAPRLFYRDRVTLVAGREKLSGKSTLLTAAAAAVTRGGAFLDGRCAEGAVLWVTADQEHAGEITQRAVRFGADPERFYVLWPRQPFADVVAALDGLQPFPACVVIDTLASFARTLVRDPFSSAQWPDVLMPLIRLARDGHVAVAIAHHAGKSEGAGYRDSTAIGALVDLILELGPDGTNPARRNVKVVGRWPAPNFAVELVRDAYHLVAGSELSLDAKVLAHIGQHPRTTKAAVRAALGSRHDETDAAISRLLASGAIADDSGTGNRHAYSTATGVTEPSEDADVPF